MGRAPVLEIGHDQGGYFGGLLQSGSRRTTKRGFAPGFPMARWVLCFM